MSDLPARLRENAELDAMEHGNPDVIALEREAADRIEQLEAELAARIQQSGDMEKLYNETMLERDMLAVQADNLLSQIGDIARVAGIDIPDCIDNDGQPYQSAALAEIIDAALKTEQEKV